MTFKGNNGKTYTVYEPGYTIDTTSGTPTIRPTRPEDINVVMSALSNGNTGGTGTPGDTTSQAGNKIGQVETLNLQDLISEATATQINDTLQEDETTETPAGTGAPPPDTPPPDPDPVPIPVNVRVLTNPGTFTAYGHTTDETDGILGGDPNATGDDFIWTFDIVGDRFTATITGLTEFELHVTRMHPNRDPPRSRRYR